MKHTGVQACSKTVARIVSELDGLILGAELRYGKHGPKYFVSDLFPIACGHQYLRSAVT